MTFAYRMALLVLFVLLAGWVVAMPKVAFSVTIITLNYASHYLVPLGCFGFNLYFALVSNPDSNGRGWWACRWMHGLAALIVGTFYYLFLVDGRVLVTLMGDKVDNADFNLGFAVFLTFLAALLNWGITEIGLFPKRRH